MNIDPLILEGFLTRVFVFKKLSETYIDEMVRERSQAYSTILEDKDFQEDFRIQYTDASIETDVMERFVLQVCDAFFASYGRYCFEHVLDDFGVREYRKKISSLTCLTLTVVINQVVCVTVQDFER